MFKQASLLYLHAESSVHLGSGQSVGAIDLAIQRERYTGFPVGAASGIKGAIRAWFERVPSGQGVSPAYVKAVFGPGDGQEASEHAGAVAFTDARILLFPVRAMKGVFAWITCPTVLQRFARDLAMAGQDVVFKLPQPSKGRAWGHSANANYVDQDGRRVLLEESEFVFESAPVVAELAQWLADNVLPQRNDEYAPWRERLPRHLLVLHDDDFTFFVQYATEIQARIKLNDRKTTDDDGNLFYQENLPCDSLLYCAVLAQDDLSGQLEDEGSAQALLGRLRETMNGKRLQIGGDESVGRGIVCTHFSDIGDTQ